MRNDLIKIEKYLRKYISIKTIVKWNVEFV